MSPDVRAILTRTHDKRTWKFRDWKERSRVSGLNLRRNLIKRKSTPRTRETHALGSITTIYKIGLSKIRLNLDLLSYYIQSRGLIRSLKLNAPWFLWWGNRKGKGTIIRIIGYLTCVCYFTSSTLKSDLRYSHQRWEKWGLWGEEGGLRNRRLNKDLSSFVDLWSSPTTRAQEAMVGECGTLDSQPLVLALPFMSFGVLTTHWTSSLALAFLFSTMGMPTPTLPAHIYSLKAETQPDFNIQGPRHEWRSGFIYFASESRSGFFNYSLNSSISWKMLWAGIPIGKYAPSFPFLTKLWRIKRVWGAKVMGLCKYAAQV